MKPIAALLLLTTTLNALAGEAFTQNITVKYSDQGDAAVRPMLAAGLHRATLTEATLRHGVTIAAAMPRGNHTYTFTLGRQVDHAKFEAIAAEMHLVDMDVELVSAEDLR